MGCVSDLRAVWAWEMPQIVAETAFGWVVDKPAGWLSVRGHGSHPVVGDWLESEVGARVWPVHRLDLETSGVLLFARNAEAHRRISTEFEKGNVKKQYLALAGGGLNFPILKVTEPISGKRSVTQFEVLSTFRNQVASQLGLGGAEPTSEQKPKGMEPHLEVSFLRALPLTGRRHQIRIHAKSIGAPLLGDATYGGIREGEVKRVALHAYQISLGAEGTWQVPLPPDFRQWLRLLTGGQLSELLRSTGIVDCVPSPVVERGSSAEETDRSGCE